MTGVELTPLPDLHSSRDMERSPGGTLFPLNLVKLLISLRDQANDRGNKIYDEENNNATVKREEGTNRQKDRNPDSIIPEHPL